MPYIANEDREPLLDKLLYKGTPDAENAGELNFILSFLVTSYVAKHGLKYQVLNDVVGALEGCKAEFQRRLVNPYEDKKIAENSDLFNYSFLEEEI